MINSCQHPFCGAAAHGTARDDPSLSYSFGATRAPRRCEDASRYARLCTSLKGGSRENSPGAGIATPTT
jgi:hypothetical protein